jgi:hypothetical protein
MIDAVNPKQAVASYFDNTLQTWCITQWPEQPYYLTGFETKEETPQAYVDDYNQRFNPIEPVTLDTFRFIGPVYLDINFHQNATSGEWTATAYGSQPLIMKGFDLDQLKEQMVQAWWDLGDFDKEAFETPFTVDNASWTLEIW